VESKPEAAGFGGLTDRDEELIHDHLRDLGYVD
jgi:hypothetical protein